MGSECSLILPEPNLYLGGVAVLRHLDAYGITASLSVCPDAPTKSGVKVLQFKIEDSTFQKVSNLFEEAVEWLVEQRLQGEVILVHCHAGISRSSTFLAAYLMTVFNWSKEEAIKYLKHCRDCASPNSGFKQELRFFEKHFRDDLLIRLFEKHGDALREMIERDQQYVLEMRAGFETNPSIYFNGDCKAISVHSSQNVEYILRVGKAIHEIEDDGDVRLWYIQSRQEEPRLLEDLNETLIDIATHSEGKFVLSKEPPDPRNLLSAPEVVPPPWDNAYDDVVASDALRPEREEEVQPQIAPSNPFR